MNLTTNLGPVRRDRSTDGFFAATANREFPICRCADCGGIGGPQETQCHACGSTSLTWQAASGRAVVRSWIVNHRRAADGQPEQRTIVAIGELAEGPWWWAQVAGADPAAMVEGMPLTIDFEPTEPDGELVPIFRPVQP